MKLIKELVQKCDMIQLSNKGHSIRIRKHRFSEGKFYCTIRDFKERDSNIETLVLSSPDEVSKTITNFIKGYKNFE